jgi:hypothetical protein
MPQFGLVDAPSCVRHSFRGRLRLNLRSDGAKWNGAYRRPWVGRTSLPGRPTTAALP